MRYLKRTTIYLIFLFWAAHPVGAQSVQLTFQHLGKATGLDVRYNSFIQKDSRGFAWISSLQGVYRFDGRRLEHFLIKDENGRVVSDQNVQSSFWEDREGNLWFSTYNALQVYERRSGRFRTIQVVHQEKTIDEAYHVFHLEKQSGKLWLKAGDRIWTYQIQTGDYRSLPNTTAGMRFAVDTSSSGEVRAIVACPWFGGPGVEYFYIGKDETWHKKTFTEEKLGEQTVAMALRQGENAYWLFSNNGLWRWDPWNGDLAGPYRPTETTAFTCWSGAFLTGERYILLSAIQKGLWIFDTTNREFVRHWLPDEEDPGSLATESPMEVYVDYEQQVWIAHYGTGVDYSLEVPDPFADPLQGYTEGARSVVSLLESANQQIWTLAGNQVVILTPEGAMDRKLPYPGEELIQISIDSSGRQWGISQNAIFRWENEAGSWEAILTTPKRLISLFHLPSGRKLVLSNEGAFDLTLGPNAPSLRRSEEFSAYRDYPFYHFIRGNGDRTFIPYHNNDLWVASEESDRLVILDSFHLGADTYSAFQFPRSDSIWLGADRGLWLYHGHQIIPVLQDDWQKEGYGIYGLLGDRKHRLWFATNQGLRLYDPQTGSLSKFTTADGLTSNTFTAYAHLAASDGKLWFGTDDGLVVFHPDSVHLNTPPPRAYIEKLWINNAPYEPDLVIGETDSLSLHYRQNTLDLQLIAIGYYQPENSALRYRLAGYDDTWAETTNGGFARFTKIPPGAYTFEVVGVNANGIEGEGKELHIYVKPPFWQTLWFRLLATVTCILLITAVVGAYYQRKLRAQRVLLEKQKALQSERDRIAKELHDDLGGDLSNILYISDDLLFDLPEGESKNQMQRIATLAQGSIDSMREFIWVKDDSKNTLADLISKLQEFIPRYLADNKLAYRLDIPDTSIPPVELGSEKRRNIYLIVKEALHNVVKHAGAQNVTVRMDLNAQQILLEIRDDGRGFDPEQRAGRGNGLGNMAGRAAATGGELSIQSAPGSGTELRLTVPMD